MEHGTKSGVQLSDGVEMEAYGDQEALSSNDISENLREEPSKKPCNRQHSDVQLARIDMRV